MCLWIMVTDSVKEKKIGSRWEANVMGGKSLVIGLLGAYVFPLSIVVS